MLASKYILIAKEYGIACRREDNKIYLSGPHNAADQRIMFVDTLFDCTEEQARKDFEKIKAYDEHCHDFNQIPNTAKKEGK